MSREISVSLTVTDPPKEVMEYMTRLFGEVMGAGYQVSLSATPIEYEDEEPQRPPLPPDTALTQAISQDDTPTVEYETQT